MSRGVRTKMRIAIIQPDTVWENPKANIGAIGLMLKEASEKGADIAALPEMCLTGFTMNTSSAEEESEVVKTLAELASGNNIGIIAGAQSRSGAPRNAAYAVGRDGKFVSAYYKIKPFKLLGEHSNYRPGESASVFTMNGLDASVLICYDLRFPELFRKSARSVSAFFVLGNWPSARQSHWETLLRARAIENQCYVIGANRTGRDGNGIDYEGGSAVFGPMGEELLRAGKEPGVYIADIDPDYVSKIRRDLPFLADMTSVS